MKHATLRNFVFLAGLNALALTTAIAAPHRARIVDFGSKLGTGFYRGHISRSFPAEVDRDGNGTLDNDTVWAWAFSLDEPLNPPGLDYDTDAKNAVFYGGLTLYAVNNPERKITEGHPNTNHEMRDDLNFMALAEPRSNEVFEGYATWFWQKKDFINGGDRHPVSFDGESFIAVHVSRYWGGVNAGRWLVRDGDRFFLSEATFANENRAFYLDCDPADPKLDGANNPVTHHTHTLVPASTRWAPYTPRAPYQIDFDESKAVFQSHTFKDVTAVGFFINRRLAPPVRMAKGLLPHQPMGVKWNAFRCDAVIDRPSAPSHCADLAAVQGDLFLQRAPVSYALWKKVWRFGVTRQYPHDLGPFGYAFLRDGSMGAMRVDGKAHATSEPVTDIAWWDAALFCNALSELEGLTPCYYIDEAFAKVAREACVRSKAGGMEKQPALFWKREADGFRLPTAAEWARGTKPAAGFWEYVWQDGTPACTGPEAPTQGALPVAERPLREGSPRIGFRIARGPAQAESAKNVWMLRAETALSPARPLDEESLRETARAALGLVVVPKAGFATLDPVLDRDFDADKAPKANPPYDLAFSRTEIPYMLWNAVCLWGSSKGYTFNHAGDMGSMGRAVADETHRPDEPVTMLTLSDAMVWCNALSELLGREPVYTSDAEGREVYRNALAFRIEMFRGKGYPNYPFRTNYPKGTVMDTASYVPVYQRASANGFRLPLPAEWRTANLPDKAVPALEGEWLAGNSGGQTQPVGIKSPNALGLYDMGGNVAELMWGSTVSAINGAPRRLGDYFYRAPGTRHPNLDTAEHASTVRAHFGFRVVTRTP